MSGQTLANHFAGFIDCARADMMRMTQANTQAILVTPCPQPAVVSLWEQRQRTSFRMPTARARLMLTNEQSITRNI